VSSGFHPTAVVSTKSDVAEHVRLGALAVVEDGAAIGDITSVGAKTLVARDVRIGAGCLVGAGCILGTGLFVEDRAIISDGVVSSGLVNVEEGARVGPAAVLVGGTSETLVIGAGATVYPGEVVTEDVPSPSAIK